MRIFRIPLTFLFMVCLAGCKPGQKSQAETPVLLFPITVQSDGIDFDVWDGLSPDGAWSLHEMPNGHVVSIVSMGNPRVILKDGEDQDDELIKLYSQWSPDGKKIAMSTKKEPGYCNFDSIFIYNIRSDNQLERSSFKLPTGENCPYYEWSPDSMFLAVSDFKGNIFILRTNAELELQVKLADEGPFGITWAESGIYLSLNIYNNEKDKEVVDLYYMDPKNPAEIVSLYHHEGSFLGVEGIDPQNKRLLLSESIQMYEKPQLKLWVFDIGTRQVIKKISQAGYTYSRSSPVKPPNSLPWVGFVFYEGLRVDTEKRLYLFDWSQNVLIDYGEIRHLVGWRAFVDGFLVIKAQEGNYMLDVIKP